MGAKKEFSLNFVKHYIEKAIKSLLKRLRQSKQSDALENLRRAIMQKRPDTKCVRIPRSLGKDFTLKM